MRLYYKRELRQIEYFEEKIYEVLIHRTEKLKMSNKGRTGKPVGRPRKPEELTENQKRLLNQSNDGSIPTPPDYIADDEDALNFWVKMFSLPHVTSADAFQVEIGAIAWSDFHALRRALRMGHAPRTITNANRTQSDSPAWKDYRNARADLNSVFSSLGIGPSERARLSITEEGAELALKTLLQQQREARSARREAAAKAAQKEQEES